MESSTSTYRGIKPIRAIAVCCAVALAGTAGAQVPPSPMLPPTTSATDMTGSGTVGAAPNGESTYGQGMYGQGMSGAGLGAEVERPSARSLFALTIATLVAQGIGSGLSQGLGGSIVKWFRGADGAADSITTIGAASSHSASAMSSMKAANLVGGTTNAIPTGSPALTAEASAYGPRYPGQRPYRGPTTGAPTSGSLGTAQAPRADVPGGELQAGIAYEVHRLDPRGNAIAVDPVRHTFRTNDRFQVFYRPTLPGRIDVVNVNPDGVTTRIETVAVAAGALATLGPYRFVGTRGEESLRLVMRPCTTPALQVATRNIVRASTSISATSGTPVRLTGCDEVGTRSIGARPRSIVKASVDGTTAFALDRVTAAEISAGSIAPREVTIRLRHE